MEEIKEEGNGINVDDYLANLKAKEEGAQAEFQIPKTTDVLRPPDPMDVKPTLKATDVDSEEVDPDKPKAAVVKMQWIKGEKLGSVEEVDREEDGWIIFKSGGRVNVALKTEFLSVVDSNTHTMNIQAELDVWLQSSPKTAPVVAPVKSPITALLEKSSSMTDVTFALEIKVNSPTPELLAILVDSFGEEACKEVTEYLIDQVDTKALIAAAREKVERMAQSTTKS